MPEMADVLNNDAFGVVNLTNSFAQQDHVPGRAGQLVFQGLAEGITTDTVVVEIRDDTLGVIQSQPRGTRENVEERRKRKVHSLVVPHIPLDDNIRAAEVRNVRMMGMEDAVETVSNCVNRQLTIMGQRHDMTIENLRLGALLGILYDADGSTLHDLFSVFGVSQEAAVSFELDVDTTDVRALCQTVRRTMERNAKLAIPNSARLHAFCGDDFFDALISHPEVKAAYDGYAAAERRLGGDYSFGIWEHGGIFFENYRGSDNISASANTTDGGGVGIEPDECRFFWTGVPGLYGEYYAPGDFVEAVGNVGLPRYASVAVDPMHGRYVDIHTEQNPLPICLRPRTLMQATLT